MRLRFPRLPTFSFPFANFAKRLISLTMSSPNNANFGAGLFPEDENRPKGQSSSERGQGSSERAPREESTPIPARPSDESEFRLEPPTSGGRSHFDEPVPHTAPGVSDWSQESRNTRQESAGGADVPVPMGSDSDLFGDVIPIDDSTEAKAAALRTHRRESTESRGVERLDDHVHGAELPARELDEPGSRRRGGRRPREEGPRRPGGRGGDRGGDRHRRRNEGPPQEAGAGHAPGHSAPGHSGRGTPRNFPIPLPESLIEAPPPPYGGQPGGYNNPGYNNPNYSNPGAGISSAPAGYGAPAPPPSYSGGSGYGSTPPGEVGGLRREIEELRSQLQRSLTTAPHESMGSELEFARPPLHRPLSPSGGSGFGSSGSNYGEPSAPTRFAAPTPVVTPPAATLPSMALFAAQRVAILADVPSLQRSAKKNFGRVVSFSKLLTSVLRGRGAVRAIAFFSERDANDGAFVTHLRSTGFELRRSDMGAEALRRPEVRGSLPLEAMRLAMRVDCLVLAGCDAEMLTMIPSLKAQGCKVEVASFPDMSLEAVRDTADSITFLGRDELIQ